MMPITSSSMYNTYYLNNVNAETSTPVEAVKPEALVNRRFVLTQVNGAKPADRFTSMEFNENFMLNARGSNYFGGQVTYENGVLKHDRPFHSTFVAESKTEMLLKNVLHEGAKVSMNGNALILQSNVNTLVFE